MTQLSPGDQVVCRVKDCCIVNPYSPYDYEQIFEIVGYCDGDYMIYVPQTCVIKDSIYLGAKNIRHYNVDKRFIDSTIHMLNDSKIARVHKRVDGLKCGKCQDFYGMAAPNQPNGGFICWSCRKYPHYK